MDFEKVRILMIAPQPFFTPRGTPFSEYFRIKALTEHGHTVDLVTYHLGRDVDLPGLTIHRIPDFSWIRHVPIGPSIAKIFLDIFIFFLTFSLLRKKRFDLLHTHEEAVFMGVLFRRMFKIPHLYDMHSDLAQQMGNFRVPGHTLLSRFVRWMERSAIRKSDFVIGICSTIGETIENFCTETPHMVIENSPLPYDPDQPSPALPTEIAQKLESVMEPVILYTGTFEVYQGLDLLLDAASLFIERGERGSFVCVGGTEQQIAVLSREIHRRGNADRFLLIGQRPPEEMPAYMERATILVSPRSSGTNTPLKIYSYLASGKAICATDLLTHTQVLSSAIAHLVKPDAESLCDGMLRLCGDSSYRDSLGTKALEYYRKELSYSRYQTKVQNAVNGARESWQRDKMALTQGHYSLRVYQQKEFAANFDAERFGSTFGKMLSRLELETFLRFLEPADGLSILDAGGGTGRLSMPLLNRGARMTILDTSQEMMTIAREKLSRESSAFHLVRGSVDVLPFQDVAFDWVICSRVIMHIPQWRHSIREFCRVAKEGVVFDFPPMIAFPALAVPILSLKKLYDPATQNYHVIHVNKVIHELHHLGFDVFKIDRRFFLPVAVHRKLNNPQLTLSLEKLFRLLGLTSLCGAPATVCAFRKRETS